MKTILLFVVGTSIRLSAQSLSEDSTFFAGYWNLWLAGDSIGAAEYLLADDETWDRRVNLENFLAAAQAFAIEDYASVPMLLDLGVPTELSDHALWLRAAALEKSGQTDVAAGYWNELSQDSTSVYAADALLKFAERDSLAMSLTSVLELSSRLGHLNPSASQSQQIEFVAAEQFAKQNRHKEAVDRLWMAYLMSPRSDQGKLALEALKQYSRNHYFNPREETAAEFELELQKLESGSHFTYGLSRVTEKLDKPSWSGSRDMLLYYKGRFLSGLRRNRDALEVLQLHYRDFPNSPYRLSSLFYLARSAYLRDEDSLAVRTINLLVETGGGDALVGDALKMLGTLYLDRGFPEDAVRAFRRWREFARGRKNEDDSLWFLGWSQWEAKDYSGAAATFDELTRVAAGNGYEPAALYWTMRSSQEAGMRAQSEVACTTLKSRYPNSHYSQLLKDQCGEQDKKVMDLIVLPLDSIYQNGGPHAKKFALLCALRLPEYALKEWRATANELSSSQSMAWWKAQVYYWNGDRYNAWLTIRASLSKYILSSGSRPVDFYNITYPLDYDPFILKRANDYDLNPYFVFALICQESHYEEEIESGAGAIGLMQLMPETARREARKMGLPFDKNDLYSAETNLTLGISHLAELFEEFHNDSVLVLAAYNAGKSAAQAWFEEFGDRPRDEFIELIPYRETRLFIKNIMEHQAAYRRIYPNLLSESIHEASSETETPK